MARAFTRQLGTQAGTQLAPIKDLTEGAVLGLFDQTVALTGKFSRGRIDKPFTVNLSNFKVMLGNPASISISALNETYSQAYECLQAGARQLLVYRLTTSAAVNSWATFTSAVASTFAVAATPSSTATFNVQHLGCFNDGIKLKVHADTYSVSGVATANPLITVVILDANNVEMYRITGSLTQGSVDEFGESNYLPDVSAMYFGDILAWNIPTGGAIGPTHDGYGRDSVSNNKFAASSTLLTFTEGGTGYLTADYDRAVVALRDTPDDFGYIISGGTRAVALISKLADLGYDTNRQFIWDIPGDLTVSGAVSFAQSLGFGVLGKDHYPQAYFAPIKALDMVNNNVVICGTGGAQAGYRCARNRQTNSYGLPAKNYPIAGGINGVLQRVRVTQILSMSEGDLSDLADAKINPVMFVRFNAGQKLIFADSLTCAAVKTSYRKLISVAEMMSHLDEMIVRFGREQLQLPMEVAIKRITEYAERVYGYAKASGWLVQPDDPNLAPYTYLVSRKSDQPADGLNFQAWLHFDGVNRQTYVQSAIV